MLKEESWSPKDELWKKVWKFQGPTLFAGYAFKDILHVIRDCTLVKEVWKQHFSLASRQVTDAEIKSIRGEPLWILGYNKYLGNCSIIDAELWGILECLKLIQRRGKVKVVIQFDSLEEIKAIHGSVLKASRSALIRRIQRILSQENNWILRYIPREQNQSANFIAKLAFGEKEDL
ncbi:hypothetical protein Goari_006056 [Gossypium aridum]|uniref:RNase H type-1 domain-containing protein n=1 Tax=Gossypium aridum TaxID=34290 RepID=A0A7J8XMY0_GOSAI|nr:hypothetical protein [Gossypium aridum]